MTGGVTGGSGGSRGRRGKSIDVRYVTGLVGGEDSDCTYARVIGIFFILRKHVENSFEGSNPYFCRIIAVVFLAENGICFFP